MFFGESMEKKILFDYIKKNIKILIIKLILLVFFIITFYIFISYLKTAFSVLKEIKNTIEVEKNITKNLLNSFLEEDDEYVEEEIDFESLKKISFQKNEFKLEKIKEFCSRICIRHNLYAYLEKSDSKYEINFFSEFNDLFITKKKKRLEKEILKYFKKIK